MPTANQSRLYWLDAVRVLACFLVCLIHAPLPDTSSQGSLWISAYNYVSAPCIGLFFMVSGALLFPVKQGIGTFIRKRLLRIGLPLLFWSAVCVMVFWLTGKLSFNSAILSFLQIPFKPVTGVYWFMYTIFGLYLFAPIISPAVSNEKLARYYLVIWGITLVLPYANAWIPNYWTLTGDIYHPFYEFHGYLGYMVLGYYLRLHLPTWKVYIYKILLPGSALAIIIPVYFLNGRHAGVTNNMLYGYLTINVACMCAIFFIGIALLSKYIPTGGGRNKLMQDISQKTFGIYLIHILVMREWLWNIRQSIFPNAGYAIQIPCVAIMTFIASYLIIKLISYIPGSKYIL